MVMLVQMMMQMVMVVVVQQRYATGTDGRRTRRRGRGGGARFGQIVHGHLGTTAAATAATATYARITATAPVETDAGGCDYRC